MLKQCEAIIYTDHQCGQKRRKLRVHPETGLGVCEWHHPATRPLIGRPANNDGLPGLFRYGGIPVSGRGFNAGKSRQSKGDRIRDCAVCRGSLWLYQVTVYDDSYHPDKKS